MNMTNTIVLTADSESNEELDSFDEFTQRIIQLTEHTPYTAHLYKRTTIVGVHTTPSHMVDIIEVLEEELTHWQDILSDDPKNDQAGRRSASVHSLLCDLNVPGYEAP